MSKKIPFTTFALYLKQLLVPAQGTKNQVAFV
jgi:hypothetical protein